MAMVASTWWCPAVWFFSIPAPRDAWGKIGLFVLLTRISDAGDLQRRRYFYGSDGLLGRRTVKVVPLPGCDATSMVPW